MTKTPTAATLLMIRPATIGDVMPIAQVHVASWQETYPGLVPQDFLDKLDPLRRATMWTEVLSAGSRCVYVAADAEGHIVGFASGGENRTPEHPYAAELYTLYLLKAHHGKGAGKALFDAVVTHLKRDGHRSMLLWVMTGNKTEHFYKALGGKEIVRKTFELAGAEVEEIGLGWDLL